MKVTVCLFFLFLFALGVCPAFSAVLGDYNGDSQVTVDDVVIFLAWVQIQSNDPAAILTRAKKIFADVQGTVANIPNTATDDFNKDGELTVDDVVLLLAWNQISVNDSPAVLTRARKIFADVSGSLERFPGVEISSDSVAIHIGPIIPQ
ncbi:MAG: hypothetical protein WA705_19350 [Candidatus Ozemobacteraceae bacterium]